MRFLRTTRSQSAARDSPRLDPGPRSFPTPKNPALHGLDPLEIALFSRVLDACRVRITQGKGGKDRVVPFPESFKETLALHIDALRAKRAVYLFESSWKKSYTDRGVRKILARYTMAAGITASISPHKLRHFLFTWLKTQGIDDALIQPYSGHETRQSLEIYSRLALSDAQETYQAVIDQFPV